VYVPADEVLILECLSTLVEHGRQRLDAALDALDRIKDDDGLQTMPAQTLDDAPRLLGTAVHAAIVRDGVIDEQNLGLDLHETLKDGMDAGVGTDAGPDGADARGGEGGDEGVGVVAEEAGDAVVRVDIELVQGEGAAADALAQVGPGDGARGHLVGFDDGG